MKTKIKITFSIIILVLIILFSSFPISSLVLFSVNQGVSQDDDVFDQNEPIDNQDQVKIEQLLLHQKDLTSEIVLDSNYNLIHLILNICNYPFIHLTLSRLW